jgi:hypothetical protein
VLGLGYLLYNSREKCRELPAAGPGIQITAEAEPGRGVAMPARAGEGQRDDRAVGTNQFYNKGWPGHEVNPNLCYLEGTDGRFYVCGQPMPRGVINVGYAQRGEQIRKRFPAPEPVRDKVAEAKSAPKAQPSNLGKLILTLSPEQMSADGIGIEEVPSGFKRICVRKSTEAQKSEYGDYYMTVEYGNGRVREFDLEDGQALQLMQYFGYDK